MIIIIIEKHIEMKEREFVWLHFVLKVLTRQGKDNIYIYIYIVR